MTRNFQPGKKGSISGRPAVDFKGGVLQPSHPPPGCRELSPSDSAEPYKMNRHAPIRLCVAAGFALLLAALPGLAQPRKQLPPEPRQQHPDNRQNQPQSQREEHLERWMQSHAAMSLTDQQHALQNEPGFRELPPQVQQNRLNTLARLYNMNPQQRSRILDRTEALERLAPMQRQQWRDAVQHLNMLPQPRKHMLAGAIIELRELPPEQREAAINSPAYAGQFTPDERQTLRTLMMAEPYPALRTPRPAYPPPPVP